MLSFIKKILKSPLVKSDFAIGLVCRAWPEPAFLNTLFSVFKFNPEIQANLANFILTYRQDKNCDHILQYLLQDETRAFVLQAIEFYEEYSNEDETKPKLIEGENNEETSASEWKI